MSSDIKLELGDCIEVLAGLPENSISTCICDPPYELNFMGKKWDSTGIAFQPETWKAVFRVLKPGALLLAFGGTRTYHRMVCAIEDAGFEIRDTIAWIYSTGFPKNYDIAKGIDKQAGAKRERIPYTGGIASGSGNYGGNGKIHVGTKVGNSAITPESQLWQGWGTALKPSHEDIVVAMKPIDGTYVHNALTWGVAGMWIDGGRIEANPKDYDITRKSRVRKNGVESKDYILAGGWKATENAIVDTQPTGRYPANVILDGSDEVVGLFPHSAARFFYSVNTNECSLCGHTLAQKHNITMEIPHNEELYIPCKSNVNIVEKNLKQSEKKQDFAQEVAREKQQQEQGGKSQKHYTGANNAEKSLWNTSLTKESIAQLNALDLPIEKTVQFVKSVGNLCDSCAINIVQEVVKIKTLDSKKEESQAIQDFITDYRKCILIQSLAQFAENVVSIDTTPTMTSLSKLFGYANLAITNYIQETEKTAPKRFLYTPKASRKERNAGLEGMPEGNVQQYGSIRANRGNGYPEATTMQNTHPSVKPLKLMQYLARLTKTPTGGTVLDPFMGSGSTGCACVLEGRDFIGIELESEYFEIAKKRIEYYQKQAIES